MNKRRYIRQTILTGFGQEGQAKLAQAKVLVIGAGGLGVPVLTYLNAMGVGTLGIVDNDNVAISNLHRQVLYREKDVGMSKVDTAKQLLALQNPDTNIVVHKIFLNKDNALSIISEYDVIVDASDNFPTRYLVNDACVLTEKPLVYGALHGFEGQVSVFNYKGGPTYRCLFPKMPKANEVPDCNENGVLGIVPGIIGNLQALETVKVLTDIGDVLSGKLLLFDGLSQSYQKIQFKLDPENLSIDALQDDYGEQFCETVPIITAEALEGLLNANAQIVDVRTPQEYQDYHLPKTLHIPLADLDGQIHKIDFSLPVYLLCQSGMRSKKALEALRTKNPDSTLISIAGGLNQYMALCS